MHLACLIYHHFVLMGIAVMLDYYGARICCVDFDFVVNPSVEMCHNMLKTIMEKVWYDLHFMFNVKHNSLPGHLELFVSQRKGE